MSAIVIQFPGATTDPAPDLDAQIDFTTSMFLERQALDFGWAVRRRDPRYFTAERTQSGVTTQVGVHVRDGQLRSSRQTVVARTDVTDQVIGWLEDGGR